MPKWLKKLTFDIRFSREFRGWTEKTFSTFTFPFWEPWDLQIWQFVLQFLFLNIKCQRNGALSQPIKFQRKFLFYNLLCSWVEWLEINPHGCVIKMHIESVGCTAHSSTHEYLFFMIDLSDCFQVFILSACQFTIYIPFRTSHILCCYMYLFSCFKAFLLKQ